ncbi:MAG: FAD:protein FMN transferase [Firmicutes bacterium]|nr:FAD:protein FMN transferase [Bacillota bacterium]
MQRKIITKLNILILIAMIVVAGSLSGCGSTGTWSGYSKQSFYFDTICEITIFDLDPAYFDDLTEDNFEDTSNALITDAFKLMSEYEKTLSRTIDGSDIDRINKASGEATAVNEETLQVISKGIGFGDLSGGVFDITVGKASALWDFHESLEEGGTEVPSAEALKEASGHIDYKAISIDEASGTVRLDDPEMMLDLGGIAKGYIADRVSEYLRGLGVTSGIVNLGGNIEVIGGKAGSLGASLEEQSDFSLGIRDPLDETGGLLGIYPGRDVTIVTSGTYERFIEVDGVKYHHILDPETGWPVDTDVLQVSVIAGAGHSADCDGLSTVCLALGSDKGTELIKELAESGEFGPLEAIFVTTDGEIIYTNEDTAFLTD